MSLSLPWQIGVGERRRLGRTNDQLGQAKDALSAIGGKEMKAQRRTMAMAAMIATLGALGLAPAQATEVDDIQLRAAVVEAEPFAISDAAVEDTEHATVFADITQQNAGSVSCAPTALAYAHQTQRTAPPAGIVLGRDVIAGAGNCASPLVLVQYYVVVCVGVFKYNSSTGRYDIKLYQVCSASPAPSVAGQGASAAADVHVYAYNTYPFGFVRGCVWFTQPYNTEAGRTCTPPSPVI